MAQYATCECYYCHIRLPKPNAYCVTIERETGHSSGSFRFYRRSSSYSTGRTYYRKRDIWLCGNCYLQYKKQQRVNALSTFVVIGLFIAGGIWIFGSNTSQPTSQNTSAISVAQPSVSEQADEKALYQGQSNSRDSHQSDAAIQIQSRLIQLGYLAGPPDGIWGVKSQKALRAFKAANGLDPSDSWDEATSEALFSSGAAYAPAPPASQTSASTRRNPGR
jgi:Putative peptidoglycan binding domain